MKVGDLVKYKPDGSYGIIIKEYDSRQRSYDVLGPTTYMTRIWIDHLESINKK